MSYSVVRAISEASSRSTVSTPAQTTVNDTAGQVLAANVARKGLVIQNTGLTVIKVNFGTETPTQSVYHVALAACTAANDGRGGVFVEDALTLAVQAISDAVGGTIVITEIT